MARVVPTVTAYSPSEYKTQIDVACALSQRISLDFMDGIFTPKKNINPIQAYWPPGKVVDIHLMYQKPAEQLETLVSLKPSLVIVHAEAEADFSKLFADLQGFGIRCGLAILAKTEPGNVAELLKQADHALLFSGNLGSFGGSADLSLLQKVTQIRAIKPALEISWDGGVNAENAANLVRGGIDVLNVGGFIQNSKNPQNAYATLEKNIEEAV